MEHTTHLESAAIRAVGAEGWEPCIFEAVVNGTLVRGGIPKLTTAGKKKWPAQKNMGIVVLTDADVKAEYARYEAETGYCGDCYGEGKRVVGWHYIEGYRFAPCVKCGETGRTPLHPDLAKLNKYQ